MCDDSGKIFNSCSRSCRPVFSAARCLVLTLAALAPLAGAGCGGHNSPPPADARRVHVGQGAVHSRAHGDGTAWVKDETTGDTLWTGPVHRGDTIDLNIVPGVQGTLSVGGDVKARGNWDPGHSYTIYQKP